MKYTVHSLWFRGPSWFNAKKNVVTVYSVGGGEAKYEEARSGSLRGTQIWWPNINRHNCH